MKRGALLAVKVTVSLVLLGYLFATSDLQALEERVRTADLLLLFAAVVAPLGVALGGWIHDPDRAASVGVILTMVMAALGGCWWPLEVVSKPLKTVALLFPSGWAMRTLHGVVSFGQTLGEMRLNLVALIAFGVAFGILASRSLRVD